MRIIGQKKLQNTLQILIKAAETKSLKVLKPILLTGPSGYGKTTIAKDIAGRLGKNLIALNGVAVQDMKKFAVAIYKMTSDDILFIDEIHSLGKDLQEILYTVLEENKLTIPKECICVDTKPFSFIGATTDEGRLLKPMLNRFTFQFKLEEYSLDDLGEIVKDRYPKLATIKTEIAKTSRGCPRTLIARCDWLNDFFIAKKKPVNLVGFQEALQMLDINKSGYSRLDIRYLEYLAKTDTPVGLKTICSFLSENQRNIEETIEPFLLKQGMIFKTPSGRILSPKARTLLKNYENNTTNK